jgi:hypothetical protein
VSSDLDERLAEARSDADPERLVQLGCDLADMDRQVDAEFCFRRAVELGETWVSFNLGNALAAQQRWTETVAAYEEAVADGETDAWLNMGQAMEELGDFAGAIRAYRESANAGDGTGALSLAFRLREIGDPDEAETAAKLAAELGNHIADAVIAVWSWDRTEDTSLEAALRDGLGHYPSARMALAHLLCATDRVAEARRLLETGAKLGEVESWLPLGNLYLEEMDDEVAAEAAYRSGIKAGDAYSHLNLGRLLADQGDQDGAEEQFRLGAAAGDDLAIKALRAPNDDED